MRFAWPAAVVCLAAGAFLPVGNEPSSDVVAGAMSTRPGRSDPSPDLAPTTAKPKPKHPGSELSIRKIETYSRVEGGQDFVIVFDGPVPDDRISYVRDIEINRTRGRPVSVESARPGCHRKEEEPSQPQRADQRLETHPERTHHPLRRPHPGRKLSMTVTPGYTQDRTVPDYGRGCRAAQAACAPASRHAAHLAVSEALRVVETRGSLSRQFETAVV
jgi:hypothetical protein